LFEAASGVIVSVKHFPDVINALKRHKKQMFVAPVLPTYIQNIFFGEKDESS